MYPVDCRVYWKFPTQILQNSSCRLGAPLSDTIFLLARLFVLFHSPSKDKDRDDLGPSVRLDPPPKQKQRQRQRQRHDKDKDDLGPSVRLDPPLLLLLLGVLQGEAVAGEGLEHLEV